jgi:hypothetical protein
MARSFIDSSKAVGALGRLHMMSKGGSRLVMHQLHSCYGT